VSGQLGEENVGADSDRNSDQPSQQKNSANDPLAAVDLQIQRRDLDPFLDGRQAFPVDHDPAIVLKPLAEPYEGDERHDDDGNFHGVFLSHVYTRGAGVRLQVCEAKKVATGMEYQEYKRG